MHVEQAIFTSLRSRQQEGYQLAATSPGVSAEVAKELAHWGPAHDSLVINDFGSTSLNFHPLESGDYCISKTIAAGDEYSGRGGPRIYTQMLVVQPEVLARFANNPFAILEALEAAGKLPVLDHPPTALEPLPLIGRASLLQSLRIAELLGDPGTDALVEFVHQAINASRLAVRWGGPLAKLYAALLMLIPIDYRLQFSFSTGLRFSPRRPFRLLSLPPDTAEQRNLQRAANCEILDLTRRERQHEKPTQGWAYLLQDVFESRQLRVLPDLLRRADAYDSTQATLDEVAQRVEAAVQAEV